MQKIVFIMVCFLTAFILSCGSSETDQQCVTALDCPEGKVCSGGMCVDGNPSGGTSEDDGNGDSEDNGELPDGGNNLPGGDSTDSEASKSDNETHDTPTDSDNETSETPDTTNDNDNETPENPDTPTDNDNETPETPDTPNDNDNETPDTPDTPNDNDVDTPETPDTSNDNDVDTPETPDTSNDNDVDTPETPDTSNDNDVDAPETPDTPNDDDADTDDSDSETTEGDPYSDWDSTPDDEACPFVMNECVNPITNENDGCLPAMASEKDAGLCNGLDDDCDGKVDEGCVDVCQPGETQPCFKGKPNQRNVGICRDGVQTCILNLSTKSTEWSDCTGGISPQQDVCDNADNDCNGCVDDDLCCNPPINCAYDIGTAQPFTYKTINGNEIYDASHLFNDAATATWTWTLTKGPCDLVLGTTNFFMKGATTEAGLAGEGTKTTTVSGTGLSWFKVKFLLSGSYKLKLKVTRTNGEVYECEWILRVASNGLRVELCWDTANYIDIDLHLGKNGKTSSWMDSSECYWHNCDATGSHDFDYTGTDPDWGYGYTMNYDTNGNWKSMPNPRLDLDNRGEGLTPENINLDNPNNGDIFRVLVHHYSPGSVCVDQGLIFCWEYEYFTTHPVVNVYCGGSLKATYGTAESGTQLLDFEDEYDSWKVVEIKWVGDVTSDACELTPNLGVVYEELPDSYSAW